MVTINLAGLNGNAGAGTFSGGVNKSGEKEGQVKNGSIFAGNLNTMTPDRIEQKRAEARKQATQVLMNQFASDNAATDGLNEMRQLVKDLNKEISALNKEKAGYEELKSGLMDKYGLTEDSQEHQDLELIRKANKPGGMANLNKDELERLGNMGELTDYQSEYLYYDEMIKAIDPLIDAYKDQVKNLNLSIGRTKTEMLQGKGMIPALKTVEEIMKAASDEIMGMAWEDAKKHIEEEFQKLVEAAKKAAEKKEEEEEKLETAKEEKGEQEELTKEIQESTSDQSKLQSELDKIMKEAELLEEDIKGLVVDGQL